MNTETTESPVPEVPEPKAATPSVTPGTMIREARQTARLSVDDLAAHTKLARATVEALERDDFGALLEPVYVRGYYRKCAKVLNIDEKRLLDAYAERVTQKAPQAPAKLRLASGTELGSSSRLPMAMAVLFVIIAVVICAFLWWVRGTTTGVPKSLDGVLNATPGVATTTMPAPVTIEPTVEAPAAAAASDAGAPSVAPDAAPAGNEPAAAVAASPAESTASAPAAATDSGAGPLLLVFNGQSWVRVSDASGRTLLNGLVAAGERRQLDGKPPFELQIGAAPQVSVQYRGAAVDLKPYTRDNATARLTLPLATP